MQLQGVGLDDLRGEHFAAGPCSLEQAALDWYQQQPFSEGVEDP